MKAYFKTIFDQELSQLRWCMVVLGNKIEGRTKTMSHFCVNQQVAAFHPSCCLHVVGQKKSKPFVVRPSIPVLRRPHSIMVNRPKVIKPSITSLRMSFPNMDSTYLGDKRFQVWISSYSMP